MTPDRTQVRDRDWLEVCRGQHCGKSGGAFTGATGEAYQQIATENTKSEVFDRLSAKLDISRTTQNFQICSVEGVDFLIVAN